MSATRARLSRRDRRPCWVAMLLGQMIRSAGGGPGPIGPADSKTEALVLQHILRDHAVRPSVKVAVLIGELGGTEDVEPALVRLVEAGLLEVVPDEEVEPTKAAIRYSELTGYMT